jgi:multidrug/hemolysin transport system ATP-binding protein
VVVIVQGEIAAKGTPTELKEKYSHDHLHIKPASMETLVAKLQADGVTFKVVADLVKIPLKSSVEAIPLIQRYQAEIVSLSVVNGSMDDAFLNITGKEIDQYD